MRAALRIWTLVFTVCVSQAALAGGKVIVFPLEAVNVEPAAANAIQLSIINALETHGYSALKGESVTDPAGAALSEEITDTTPAGEGEAGAASRVTLSDDAEEGAPASEADDSASTPEPVAAEAAAPSGEGDAADARAAIASARGCSFYVTGSAVQLGAQVTIALELQRSSGEIVSAKKVIAPTDRDLPRAVQTIVAHIASDMSRDAAPHAAAAAPAVNPEQPAPGPASPPNDIVFQKNFGVSIGQTFSLSDEMYSYTLFSFNGRFEFNRLLLITTLGFAMGNREFEDGLHFNFDLSLAAYLLKGQISPYVGGGLGLFVGNRLDNCAGKERFVNDGYNSYYDDDGCYDSDDLVGWQVFPVVGLEVLRTFSIRLHVEARYIVAFDAYKNFGHGPMMLIGIAF